MNSETIKLRATPLLEITLQESSFQIINKAYSRDNGSYNYADIQSVAFQKKRINWFISILSLLADLFLNTSNYDLYKEKNTLKIVTMDKKIRIPLNDSNLSLAKSTVRKLQRKIS